MTFGKRTSRFVLAIALAAAPLAISSGCGTQYGGRPSSIPRDVDEPSSGTGGTGTGGSQQTSGSGSGTGTAGSGAGTGTNAQRQ